MFLHESASEFKGTMILDDLTLMRQKIEAQSMIESILRVSKLNNKFLIRPVS